MRDEHQLSRAQECDSVVCRMMRLGGYLTEREMMTAEMSQKIENWFTYHAPTTEPDEVYARYGDAPRHLRPVIADLPDRPDPDAAIPGREAVMTAKRRIVVRRAVR